MFTPVVLPTTYSKPLAVGHHSHKILVLSVLGRLVSEHDNNSFSSVNPPLWGLYCTQLRLCQICSECEAFDCCKLVCYRYLDKFARLCLTQGRPNHKLAILFQHFNNGPINDLVFLQRCIKINLPSRVRLVLIELWEMQSNHRLNFNRGLTFNWGLVLIWFLNNNWAQMNSPQGSQLQPSSTEKMVIFASSWLLGEHIIINKLQILYPWVK